MKLCSSTRYGVADFRGILGPDVLGTNGAFMLEKKKSAAANGQDVSESRTTSSRMLYRRAIRVYTSPAWQTNTSMRPRSLEHLYSKFFDRHMGDMMTAAWWEYFEAVCLFRTRGDHFRYRE